MLLTALLTMVLGCSETAQAPDWAKAKVIADKLDHPSAITTDDKNIYCVTGGTIASLNEGTSGVWKMPIDGGQPVQLFKGYQKDKNTVVLPDTFVLATDEKYVYFSAGYIYRISKDGGEPQQITAGTPTEMVLDNDKIYWHNYVGEGMKPTPIYSVNKNGGEVKTLTDAVNISAIVVDKDFMYWSQSDGIYKTPKNGGEKTKVYSAPASLSINGLIADNENFYFTQGNGKNALMKVSKNGGQATKLADEINHVFQFYVDEKFVYFINNEGTFGTSLNKVSKTGGEITKIDSGYLASYTIGKDKLFVTDIAKIYELAK
jgi:Domain of unknown function (DUF5050)